MFMSRNILVYGKSAFMGRNIQFYPVDTGGGGGDVRRRAVVINFNF